MTHDSFVKKYIGRYIDYDGRYGAQCVDLMRAYSKEVHNMSPYIAIPTLGNAKDIYTRYFAGGYKKIPNTPTGVPKQGDIIFFKTSYWFPYLYGFAGHVAIVESANVNSMTVFEQNYPTGHACKLSKHSYKDCLGWLTPKA